MTYTPDKIRESINPVIRVSPNMNWVDWQNRQYTHRVEAHRGRGEWIMVSRHRSLRTAREAARKLARNLKTTKDVRETY